MAHGTPPPLGRSPLRPSRLGQQRSGVELREDEDPGDVIILAELVDPDGRRVVLDERGWTHVIDEHGEMGAHRDAVIATVTAPHHRRPDPRPPRERFWRRGLGPSRWLLVVVDFSVQPGRVVTAYGNRKDPPDWTP
jgi:hypothetical protein